MNTKKLIGMIIGVTLFAALIAGATFAWLTFAANVQNATLDFGTSNSKATRNFTFTSPTGTNITNVSERSTLSSSSFSSGNDYVVLSLSKAADTPKASNVYLRIKKPTNGITVAGYFKYAVCKSATASDCQYSSAGNIPSSASGKWVAVGNVTTGTSEQNLYTETSVFNVTGAANMSYYIYFWYDPSVKNDSNKANIAGKTVKGNIYFYAEQGE